MPPVRWRCFPERRANRRAVEDLTATLAQGRAHAGDAVPLIRRLADHIDVIPGAEHSSFELRAYGRLAELTSLAMGKQSGNAVTALVVAGEGFRRPSNSIGIIAIAC